VTLSVADRVFGPDHAKNVFHGTPQELEG